MTLLSPIWLFLAVPLALALWVWRPPTRLLLGVRLASLLLVLLSLAGLALRLPSKAGTVVIVVDRSLSMPAGSVEMQKESIDLIIKEMGGNDRVAVVSFGERVAVERAPEVGPFAGFAHQVGGSASSLGEAVDKALEIIPTGTPGRILILSDGKWTGRDPVPFAATALARDIGIDYRVLERPAAGDLAIAKIDAPAAVSVGESYLLTAWVQAPEPGEVAFELKRGEAVIASGKRNVVSGLNRFTFRDRAAVVGNQGYSLNVVAADTKGTDPVPENNTARLLVGVTGPKPTLLVSQAGSSSGLGSLLKKGGLDIRASRAEDVRWTLEELSRYGAVILENTPADKIGHVGMETLAAWVRETGAGLVMTGGKASYAPGGYFKSPLDPLLPVSMELRNEHRKLSLAIVVALDRSGSMAVPVAGGKVKMDLANQGTAQVLDLLGPMDEFGCIAVDTEPHIIANLGKVSDKSSTRRKILNIKSMGGGIYIDEALMAASKMLIKATAGTRHIILFADANDAEQPGKYKDLLAETDKAGITVSVIGLGTERDKDADLLKDIAKRGKGRIFFSDNPNELPRLFAQDTFVVARNTFIDEPVKIKHAPGLATLVDQVMPSPASLGVGGYNLTYLKPGATLGSLTLDEYKAPISAAWRVGAGRVVCYTGEADGTHAGTIAKWDRVGDYHTSLVRWAAGAGNPLRDNMLLTQEIRDGVNRIQLHLDPERKSESFAGMPRVTTLRSLPGEAPRIDKTSLRWTGADTLTVELPLDGSETALSTVEVPGQDAAALPPVCLPYSPEFRPARTDRGPATLERLGRATGGVERLALGAIWTDLPRRERVVPIATWLLLAAVVLWLVEVLERRTALLANLFARKVRDTSAGEEEDVQRRRVTPLSPAAAKAMAGAAPVSPVIESHADETDTTAMPEQMPEEAGGMVQALRRARKKARERTD